MKSLRFLAALLFFVLTATPCFRQSALAAEQVYPFAKWEKEIAAFEAADSAKAPEKGGIVFVGSSSIRLWKTLSSDFAGLPVLNRGFGGSQLGDSVHFADRIIIPYEPRMVVVYAGGNDINAGKSAEDVFNSFKALAAKIREKLPQTRIAYISIAPNPKRWSQVETVKAANKLIADFIAMQERMDFINVFPHMLGSDGQPKPDIFVEDRLHMNAEGYKIWTEIVRPYLTK